MYAQTFKLIGTKRTIICLPYSQITLLYLSALPIIKIGLQTYFFFLNNRHTDHYRKSQLRIIRRLHGTITTTKPAGHCKLSHVTNFGYTINIKVFVLMIILLCLRYRYSYMCLFFLFMILSHSRDGIIKYHF